MKQEIRGSETIKPKNLEWMKQMHSRCPSTRFCRTKELFKDFSKGLKQYSTATTNPPTAVRTHQLLNWTPLNPQSHGRAGVKNDLPISGDFHLPSMFLTVVLSSASISFWNSSSLEDSLSPVRHSRNSFRFWSGVPCKSTSTSSSELQTLKHYTPNYYQQLTTLTN